MTVSLQSELLKNDPRVAEAKKLLQKAVAEHQEKIKEIRPPAPALKQSYEKTLETFIEHRGVNLWFPYLSSGIGNGALVELADGSIKYDLINGIGPHYLGHSHQEIISSGIDAALCDTVMQGNLQQNIDTPELLKLLVESSGMDHCFLTSSGAMACENALKIIFQKKHPAHRILAFSKCFMGRTLSLSQITDNSLYSRKGLPSNLHIDYVPFFDYKRPQESTKEAIAILKQHLNRYPEQHAAMALELIQGEAGFYPGTEDFFTAILDLLKEKGVAILIDEIQTFGRSPELFAFQHYHLESYVDVITIGKTSQVCATLFKKEFKPKEGLLSQTYTSSTSAIYASKVIIKKLLKGNYYGKDGIISSLHKQITTHLERLSKTYPTLIEGPFGLGTMLAFTVFEGKAKETLQFVHKLYEKGVIAFIAGSDPTRVRFLLPIVGLSSKDIETIVGIIECALTSNYSKK